MTYTLKEIKIACDHLYQLLLNNKPNRSVDNYHHINNSKISKFIIFVIPYPPNKYPIQITIIYYYITFILLQLIHKKKYLQNLKIINPNRVFPIYPILDIIKKWVAIHHQTSLHQYNKVLILLLSIVIHIQSKTLKNYIDKIPLYIIYKLKLKFNEYCDNNFQLKFQQFKIIYLSGFKNNSYSNSFKKTKDNQVLGSQYLEKLYEFYTDFGRNRLNYRNFVMKYAILSKCQQSLFANILYFIYSNVPNLKNKQQNQSNQGLMRRQQYQQFIKIQRNNFSFSPTTLTEQLVITKQQFYKNLKQSGFQWQESRKKFLLIDKDDMPFDAITRGLVDMGISDLIVGQEYYLVSQSWFERWSYYYQGINMQEQNYKSTKIIKPRSNVASGKKRRSLNRSSVNANDMSVAVDDWIIQRPTKITFQDIQGQFKGELKQNLKTNAQIRILSRQLWQLIKKTMPAEMQYKRIANTISSLDLYPKSIYYLQTDKDGKIIDKTFQIVHLYLKKKLKDISQYIFETSLSTSITQKTQENKQKNNQRYFFIKNFGDNIWSQQKQETALAMCSIYPRYYVVETTNKSQFIERYFRKKKTINNITYSDRVYSFFPFTKKVMPAYIIRFPNQDKALIHYLDFNFRYEIQVNIDDLSIQQDSLIQNNKKKVATNDKTIQDPFSFKGIQNIGNTCFINAIIQCLIASPLLQQYFLKKKCKEKQQPLLHQIVQLASSLLVNKKISPVKLKKTIDMELQLFSGNDQHDAQQFLSFLLDKLNQEIKNVEKQEQTVFQHLFRGKIQATLQCLDCRTIKKNQQDLTIVSLPVPQPEYNTYVLFIFPIYQTKIRKIVLRLHRNNKVADFLFSFENRVNQNCKQFLFTEFYSKSLRIRNDILDRQNKNQLITKYFPAGTQVHCFQRFKPSQYTNILTQNKQIFQKNPLYFDYLDKENDKWLYGRYLQKKSKVEIMNQDNTFSILKQKNITQLIRPLGSQTHNQIQKKLITRKYNQILQKMQIFGYYGIQYMISFPKQITYLQLKKLIKLIMSNFTKTSLSSSSKNCPYFIKICQTNKNKCIFCNTITIKIQSKQQVKQCCRLTQQQNNTPLIWIARQRQYTIFVDWKDMDQFNSQFGNVQVDSLSISAEKMKLNDKIQVQECLKKYQEPETVQMQCDKCKHKNQRRTQTIKYVPNILILHLKQYSITQDKSLIKMDVNLKWIQFLDITKYSQVQKGVIYQLYAFVRHHGTSHSGHYTCAIKRKHPFENKKVWVNFDDQITTIMENDQKNIDSAYLLFFKKVDMPYSGFLQFTEF